MINMNYNKGKIYKIVGPDSNAPVYIGSTTKDYLSQRLSKHTCNYRCWSKNPSKHKKVMVYEMFEKYGVENCKILLVKNYACLNRDELRAEEQLHIEKYNCINKVAAFVTEEQHRANKKVYDDAYNKIYHETNKERINARKAEKIVCETCNKEISRAHKSKHEKGQQHMAKLQADV